MSNTGSPAADTQRLTVEGVHHISFRVDDLDASMRFYSRTLGFESLERPDLGVRGAWLQAGPVELHLIEIAGTDTTGANPTAPTAMANHVGLRVDELGPIRKYFEDLKVPMYVHSETLPQIWIQDPDGNVIEFIARTK